jgi:tRNA(Arg) A34 adenosine deaminase TadA
MNNNILNKAIEIAHTLKNNKQRICSIVVDKKNKIIGLGVNSYSKTHPIQKRFAEQVGGNYANKIFLHSEISALISCSSKPHAIYIARVNHKGEPVKVSPCPICALMLKENNIEKVITT